MHYRNNAGGWNLSHGQIEQTPRIDSFELPMGKPWSVMYCGCEALGDIPLEVDAEADTAFIYPMQHGKSFHLKLSHKRNGYGGEQVFSFVQSAGRASAFCTYRGATSFAASVRG